jgi:hypothetical protein
MPAPYQSRVFTFVNKRANQVKDSCVKGLRHLKVAVVWGGQILLSPLQWLARLTNILQPQLPPPPQRPILTSQPVSDINIEQALELVEVAGYPILFQSGSANEIDRDSTIAFDCYRSDTLEASSPQSGGLAPAQEWQAIRAVAENSVLTVDRSVTEPMLRYRANPSTTVETYHSDSRIAPPKQTIRGLGSLLSDRQLVLVTTENEILDILSIAQQQEIRRKIGLDIALAWHQWQTVKLAGDANANQLGGNDRLSLTANSNLGGGTFEQRQLPPQNMFERFTDWLTRKQQPQTSSIRAEDLPATNQKASQQLPPAAYSFIPQPPKIDRYLDLPQLPPIQLEDRAEERSNKIGEIVTKFQPNWFKQLWSYYQDYLHIPSPTDNPIVYQPPQKFELIPLDPKPTKVIDDRAEIEEIFDGLPRSQRAVTAANNLAKKVERQLDYRPDWIDAISEEIGYSQSLWSRFLAWLDRLFLAIENWAIDLWNKIVNSRSAN